MQNSMHKNKGNIMCGSSHGVVKMISPNPIPDIARSNWALPSFPAITNSNKQTAPDVFCINDIPQRAPNPPDFCSLPRGPSLGCLVRGGANLSGFVLVRSGLRRRRATSVRVRVCQCFLCTGVSVWGRWNSGGVGAR